MSLFFLEIFEDESEEIQRHEATIKILRDRRRLRNASNTLELEEVRFKKLFRLSKCVFLKLYEDIEPKFPQSERTYAIPNILKLACLLRFCAEGGYQTGVGNDFYLGLSQTTVSDILSEMLQIFENFVCPKWIKFLYTREEEDATKCSFFESSEIPGIIGCIDGTHIKIRAPIKDLQHLYYCRRGFYSINAMVACDHKMTIKYINAKFAGACHDSHVFNLSGLKSILEERQRNGITNSWILGDAGYPLCPYLITPYRSTEVHSREAIFNTKHSKARKIMEITIGILKNRFRCLLGARELHYNPQKCTKIINVCVALHNICIHHGIAFDETLEDYTGEHTETPVDVDEENETVEQSGGSEVRNRLLHKVFIV